MKKIKCRGAMSLFNMQLLNIKYSQECDFSKNWIDMKKWSRRVGVGFGVGKNLAFVFSFIYFIST